MTLSWAADETVAEYHCCCNCQCYSCCFAAALAASATLLAVSQLHKYNSAAALTVHPFSAIISQPGVTFTASFMSEFLQMYTELL